MIRILLLCENSELDFPTAGLTSVVSASFVSGFEFELIHMRSSSSKGDPEMRIHRQLVCEGSTCRRNPLGKHKKTSSFSVISGKVPQRGLQPDPAEDSGV